MALSNYNFTTIYLALLLHPYIGNLPLPPTHATLIQFNISLTLYVNISDYTDLHIHIQI